MGDRSDVSEGGDISPQKERKLLPPMSIADLLEVEEPEEEWLIEGLIPVSANVMNAGYPKTFKTMFLLEQAVALSSGTPFLGKFKVPEQRRVGVVLMEDQPHRVRRRVERLCAGRGIDLADLDGRLHFWFRPPLKFDDVTVTELAAYAKELDLDFLGVDSWAYVASGDSNSADDVTPQLQALSAARVGRPGLTVQLTHHARKDRGDSSAMRLTDMIRNSSAFGAWYDAGLILLRNDESSPVTVRAELRDFSTPEEFAFTVEDQDPAGTHNGFRANGWLRLKASDERPELVQRMAKVERLVPRVRDFLEQHPKGVSLTRLRAGVKGNNPDIEAAFQVLREAAEADYTEPERQGLPSNYRLVKRDPAQPCSNPAQGRPLGDPAPRPVGGGRVQGSSVGDDEQDRGSVAVEVPDLFDQPEEDAEEEHRWSI